MDRRGAKDTPSALAAPAVAGSANSSGPGHAVSWVLADRGKGAAFPRGGSQGRLPGAAPRGGSQGGAPRGGIPGPSRIGAGEARCLRDRPFAVMAPAAGTVVAESRLVSSRRIPASAAQRAASGAAPGAGWIGPGWARAGPRPSRARAARARPPPRRAALRSAGTAGQGTGIRSGMVSPPSAAPSRGGSGPQDRRGDGLRRRFSPRPPVRCGGGRVAACCRPSGGWPRREVSVRKRALPSRSMRVMVPRPFRPDLSDAFSRSDPVARTAVRTPG